MSRAKFFIVFTFLLAFAVCVSAQSVQFPNELKGYEFYSQGKLKDIKLKFSTNEDVKAVFGDDCWVGGCAYNENWEVGFIYYFDGMKRYKTENKVEKTYVISPEFVNRIYTIILSPKKAISFNQISFSEKFKAISGIGEHSIELKSYTDTNGLYYTLLDDDYYQLGKGNLKSIQYSVPENLEQDMFILTQIQNEPFSK